MKRLIVLALLALSLAAPAMACDTAKAAKESRAAGHDHALKNAEAASTPMSEEAKAAKLKAAFEKNPDVASLQRAGTSKSECCSDAESDCCEGGTHDCCRRGQDEHGAQQSAPLTL